MVVSSSSESRQADSRRLVNSFFNLAEKEAVDHFLRDGYIIFDLEDSSLLNAIRKNIYQSAVEFLGDRTQLDEDDFFDKTHEILSIKELNDFRVKSIARMNH